MAINLGLCRILSFCFCYPLVMTRTCILSFFVLFRGSCRHIIDRSHTSFGFDLKI